MNAKLLRFSCLALCLCVIATTRAEPTNVAEDDASKYGDNWGARANNGSGFGNWTQTNQGNDQNRHSGFFIASTANNKDLNGIARDGKAFGLYANGTGFEATVAYRPFSKPLQVGDTFSFMMETGPFENKFEKEEVSRGGSVGLVLRSGNTTSSSDDYNKDAVFEMGHYQGKDNYQIYDGDSSPDSGVAFTSAGISVSVTVTGAETYDLEIQTLSDKKLTKLPGRKFKGSGRPESFAIFNRNSEKNDAFFNQFQVSRDEK